MSKSKKIVAGIIGVAAVLGLVGAGAYFAKNGNGKNSELAYVEKVSTLTGRSQGTLNSFAGVVEAQDTWKITLSSDKEVKEVYVKVGDEVAEGDQLFAYNTDEVTNQIEQEKLELENMQNEINDIKAQIATLTAERDAAVSEETRFDYSTQIQSAQNELKQSEYNVKSQQLEIDKLNQTLENSVVTSKMAGVVKEINSQEKLMENPDASFMTILASGAYRVKCYVNEQNLSQISEGMEMTIRSRVDEDQTWQGTIASIETGDAQEGQETEGYVEDSSASDVTTSSKYPFYVSMENSDGLILGQHVFVEPGNGQGDRPDGIWIFESYVLQEEDGAYVWAVNGDGKLEKRKVELGEYEEESCEYQITSGLDEDDYISWPQEGLKEGMGTTKDVEEAADFSGGDEMDTDAPSEDGMDEMDTDAPSEDGMDEMDTDAPSEDNLLEEELKEVE